MQLSINEINKMKKTDYQNYDGLNKKQKHFDKAMQKEKAQKRAHLPRGRDFSKMSVKDVYDIDFI